MKINDETINHIIPRKILWKKPANSMGIKQIAKYPKLNNKSIPSTIFFGSVNIFFPKLNIFKILDINCFIKVEYQKEFL